jgi:hypothetical protein
VSKVEVDGDGLMPKVNMYEYKNTMDVYMDPPTGDSITVLRVIQDTMPYAPVLSGGVFWSARFRLQVI